MSKLTRCERCGKRLRNPRGAAADAWGIRLIDGQWPASVLCPNCLTAAEGAEMEIRGATMVPSRLGKLVPKTSKADGINGSHVE